MTESKGLAERGVWGIYLLGLPAVVGDGSGPASRSWFMGIYLGPETKGEMLPTPPSSELPLRARRRENHR